MNKDRLCAFCENNGIIVIEDEYHFLLGLHYLCYYYWGKIIWKYLVSCNVISYTNFQEIMTQNVDFIQDIAYYNISE